jgi:hypothetical protein
MSANDLMSAGVAAWNGRDRAAYLAGLHPRHPRRWR